MRGIIKYLAVYFIISSLSYQGFSQINSYTRVTAINGVRFAVANTNETFDTFVAGEQVVVMQMQDNVLGNNTNTSSFGDLGSISSAGLYEIRTIDYVVRSGTLDSVILIGSLNNSYNINSNASVQLISYPTLDNGGGNFTTTGNISSVGWNGNVGGVITFNVDGILTLNHNISANNDGFIGASANGGGSAGCTPTGAYRVVTQANYADKGEGIFLRTAANEVAGRGKILNGGGGGNSHNAGGGGGGNYTAGGVGGPGWICVPTAGGIGGIALSASISTFRIFMGGGGGSGEGNNNFATGGGDGGGIILIKANVLVTSGTCGGRLISANGESITGNSSNDGSGGGGAAGSIILQIDSFSIASTCVLNVEASGGDGGSVNNGAQHGGGGGGGQGVIIYNPVQPVTNVTSTTDNGNGGCNNNSNPCTNQASGGSGSNGSGVKDSTQGPLPINLVQFEAFIRGDIVELTWETESEINNEIFYVERSLDLKDWRIIQNIPGAGDSREKRRYKTYDNDPLIGISYYRLKQVDFNGNSETFNPIAVNYKTVISENLVFPVPTKDYLYINKTYGNEQIQIRIIDFSSKVVELNPNYTIGDFLQLDIRHLKPGLYVIQVIRYGLVESYKFIKL